MTNTYSTCYRDPALLYDPPEMRLHEQVEYQVFASGESYRYLPAGTQRQCPETPTYPPTFQGQFDDALSSRTSVEGASGVPTKITDPLGRITTLAYNAPGLSLAINDATQLGYRINPEGDRVDYNYDLRGNQTSITAHPKASGPANIVTQYAFPSSCSNHKTCNRPLSMTDPRGSVTDFSYSPDHGGVLYEAGPAGADGIRPVKWYSYVQRYAWIANGSGGWVHAGGPIWVLASES